jgi:site-specific recombinase XerD
MKNPHAKLIPIEKHLNLFRNPLSEKIYFRGTIKGRSWKFSTGTSNLTEAKKIIDDKKAEIYHGKSPDTSRRRKGIVNPSLSLLWEDFYNERAPKWSKSSKVKYRVAWDHGLKDFWSPLRLANIKSKRSAADKAVEFENWYLRNKPGRAFFNTRKAILAFLRYLEEKDLIARMPKIQKLDTIINANIKRKKVGRVYEDEEMTALYEKAVNKRIRLAIKLYRRLGMRKMELLTSKKEKWDLKKKTATIWSFKNKKWRTVPIPNDLIEEIGAWMYSHDSDYMFPAPTDPNRHISSQVFDKDWTATKRAAEIRDNGPLDARIHDLRHTMATETVTHGWSPVVACAVLDMSLEEYQRTYAHVSEKHKREAMDKNPIPSL